MKRMATLLASLLMVLFSCTNDQALLEELIASDETIEEPIDEGSSDDQNNNDNNNSGDGTNNPPTSENELKAFPSAYGAGAYVTGGRGGVVIPVTRLDDAFENGQPAEGTLRYALTRQFPRIITFRVSGEIIIERDGGIYLENYSGRDFSNFTVAGQTAPEGGITIVGNIYTDRVENMIWRYVRIRKDDDFDGFDCLTVGNTRRVIFDHLSLSYGSDEAMSISNGIGGEFPSTEVTIQNCLMAHSKTGNILGTVSTPEFGGQMSYINNFITNTSHRFPNTAADGDYEVINNLVYNWTYRLLNVIDAPKLNHINNAYVAGPKTTEYYPNGNFGNIAHKINLSNLRTLDAEIYSAGNYITNLLTNPDEDNWFTWTIFVTANGYNYDDPAPKSIQVNSAHPLLGSPLSIRTAEEIMNDLPNEVGAYKTLDENGNVIIYRDELDVKWIDQYFTNTGETFAYASRAFEYARIPANAPYKDTDLDGMPDAWEIANGFNPNKQDHNEDADGDGYTNLDSFLNLVDY